MKYRYRILPTAVLNVVSIVAFICRRRGDGLEAGSIVECAKDVMYG